MKPSVLLLAFSAFTCLAAQAQTTATGPQTINVQGSTPKPVRTDVQQLCPGALDDLPDQLARTALEVTEPGLVRVQFELEGSRVLAVHTSGGVGVQARAVRRAVRGLACSSGEPGRQWVRFSVRFVDPFERSAHRAVALVETPATP